MIVKACASSANLGPGFDCFGIAWKLYNTVGFLPTDGETRICGCPAEFCGKDNLAYAAYLETVRQAGVSPVPLEISFVNSDIPISRGLGSSAALISAGVRAANAIHSLGLSERELLEIATPVEGHPDNLAPALLGGMTVSAYEGGRVISEHFTVSEKLRFAALVPEERLSTALARSVLPKLVPRGDAVFNVSRAALLLKALETGDAELLRFSVADRLHQPYRAALIPGYDTARELAYECGAEALCISGAGSTLLCAYEKAGTGEKISRSLAEKLPGWRVIPLEIDYRGTFLE